MKKKILVIDVGGSNVKLMISRREKRKFKSGLKLTPRAIVAQMKPLVSHWKFDAISMGFPSPVRDGQIVTEPKHLGKGWVGFDFEKAFGKPVHIINDAAIIEMRSWAERASGRWTRARAGQNGRSFRKADKIIMKLYFLRHGEADWPDWKKSDDERPLTKRGKKEMHEVGAFLVRLKVRPDLILNRPFH